MLVLRTSRKQKYDHLKNRVAELEKHKPEKFFHHKSFDDPASIPLILAEMPDNDNFERLRQDVLKLRAKNSHEMRACYEEPLLTKEQELHLFRKYNFLKYRFAKRVTKLAAHIERKPCLDFIYGVETAEALWKEIIKLRNLLASCNFRLSTMVLRGKESDPNQHQIRMSDCCNHVMRSVDYFDWRMGNKFSTYATWVLRNNLSRDFQNQTKQDTRFTTGVDYLEEVIDVTDEDSEKNFAINRDMALKLLTAIKDERKLRCVKQWFGIGTKRRTLKEISGDELVTKERVRQLKEAGMADIRKSIELLGIDFNPLEPEVLEVKQNSIRYAEEMVGFERPDFLVDERLFDSIALAHYGHGPRPDLPDGIRRKYNDLPYIVHPRSCFRRFVDWVLARQKDWQALGLTPTKILRMACAIWKHDVKEDCQEIVEGKVWVTDEQIATAGGDLDTFTLVSELTNPSKMYDGTHEGFPKLSRDERKAMDREHLKTVSWEAKIIKLIDRTDNLTDLAGCTDRKFLVKYTAESRALLEVIGDADAGLAAQLLERIEALEARIGEIRTVA